MDFILKIIKENKLKIFIFFCLSFLSSFLNVWILSFINKYLISANESTFLMMFYFILLLIILFCFNVSVEFALSSFGQNFIFKMQRKLVKQILDTNLIQLDKIGKAKLLASLGADTRSISFALLRSPDFLQSSILFIALLSYIFYVSYEIFILCITVLIFTALIDFILIRKIHKYFRESRNNDDFLQNAYQDIIDGHKNLSLNTFRASRYYKDGFEKYALKKRKNNKKASLMQSLYVNFTNASFLALVAFEFFLALNFNITSIQNATTIALAMFFLRAPLLSLLSAFPTILVAKIALDKIKSLSLQAYKEEFKKCEKIKTYKKIRFDNVSFSYEDKFELKPTTLEINKGELIFLIGKNGSGKSTFSLLFASLLKPNSGALYLDDMKIDSSNLLSYRKLISAIFTECHIFKELLGYDEEAKDSDIQRYLKLLKLDEKVEVKDGIILNTKLSSGQRKRLAMLLCLLEKREILILDEFAADQDPAFRRFFYKELLPLLKKEGKTILSISHDETYFDAADRIFLAQDGMISEIKGFDKKKIASEIIKNF